MSSRDYAIDDYGLVLNMNSLKELAKQHYPDEFTEEEWKEDPYGFIEGLRDTLGLSYTSQFTGEAIAVNAQGADHWGLDSFEYDDDSIVYLALRKLSTLYKAAYNSFADVVAEFETVIPVDILPNKDYSYNFRHIVGTYYG